MAAMGPVVGGAVRGLLGPLAEAEARLRALLAERERVLVLNNVLASARRDDLRRLLAGALGGTAPDTAACTWIRTRPNRRLSHSLTHSLSHSLTHTLSNSLSLSHTHTHSHTLTHARSVSI
jgi:hypothetical protein